PSGARSATRYAPSATIEPWTPCPVTAPKSSGTVIATAAAAPYSGPARPRAWTEAPRSRAGGPPPAPPASSRPSAGAPAGDRSRRLSRTRARNSALRRLRGGRGLVRLEVEGVGGLDLLAGDAQEEDDRVQVGDVDGGVGGLPDDGLRVVGDPEPGGLEHVQVVGAVADRDRLAEGDAGLAGEAPERLGLAGAVD